MNPIEFADKHLQPYKVQGSEIVARECPYCGGRHKTFYKFYLNIEKQTFKCFHGDCGKQGHFIELCRDFGEVAETNNFELNPTPKKEFKKPNVKTYELSDSAVQYAYKRKISIATLKAFGITEKDKNFVFPYHDEKNELVFVKYRPIGKIKEGQKKAFREKDGKPILFNINNIDISNPVVITEGEFDAMAVYEAGYKNVVSVPSGASDLSWVELCWDWLEKINKFILFGDNDAPGEEMIKKVILKLGEHRCYVAAHENKDANEVLYREGSQAILKVIEEAKPVPKAGIIEVADIDISQPRKRGFSTGFKTLDKILNGSKLGELTVWTGRPGEGKSTILSEIMLENIENGIKAFCYSGELTQQDFKEWLCSQAAGKENMDYVKNEFDSYEAVFKGNTLSKISKWLKGKMFLYDNTIKGRNIENTSILDLCKYAAKRYDCKEFVIDNLMTADFGTTSDKDFYRAQGRFVGELAHFAKAYNVHVDLVAHPRKSKEKHLDADDISGSGEIRARADNVIAIEKITDESEDCDAMLTVMKNRNKGVVGKIKLIFSAEDRRLYELNEDGTCNKKEYSWDKVEGLPLHETNIVCPWDLE